MKLLNLSTRNIGHNIGLYRIETEVTAIETDQKRNKGSLLI